MMDLASMMVATALGQAQQKEHTVRMQLLQTTHVATFLPDDIAPPSLGQNPSGRSPVTADMEELVSEYASLIACVAEALPVNEEADREVHGLLRKLDSRSKDQPLTAAYEDD